MPHSVVSGGARSVAPSRCSNFSNKSRVEHKLSPGTESLVKQMMLRSGLNALQQRTLFAKIRAGEALPPKCSPISNRSSRRRNEGEEEKEEEEEEEGESAKRSFYTRPAIRTLDKILQSDPYAVEPYHAKQTKNMSGEKERLQKAMASRSNGNCVIVGGGSVAEFDASRAAPRSQIKEEEEELDEVQMLLEEIAERKAWLEELEALGQAAKYRRDTNQEIELRVRRLERIHREKKKNKGRT